MLFKSIFQDPSTTIHPSLYLPTCSYVCPFLTFVAVDSKGYVMYYCSNIQKRMTNHSPQLSIPLFHLYLSHPFEQHENDAARQTIYHLDSYTMPTEYDDVKSIPFFGRHLYPCCVFSRSL